MLRTLIAEDDSDIRETVRYLLEGANYQVDEAADGAAALKALQAMTSPCVALIDLTMPKMSGIDVLRALAGQPEVTACQRYILLTARQAKLPPADAQALTTLKVKVVYKPFDIDDLLEHVRRMAETLA
ncbi:MAG: response regulator [Ktedonobacterales bacterium]